MRTHVSNSELTFQLKGWSGIVIVVGLVVFALAVNHYVFRYNPRLDELTQALQSDNPSRIGEALYESGKLTAGKGHKLIPYILPHLSDDRDLPEAIKQKQVSQIQSAPGSFLGLEANVGRVLSIGYTAALTLQGLVIMDVENRRWIGRKYRAQIVDYVLDEIAPYGDEFTLEHGLWAVNQIHDKRLIPLWFQALEIESDSIRLAAHSGLLYYIYDRTHGLFTWHPEEEIDANMLKKLHEAGLDAMSTED